MNDGLIFWHCRNTYTHRNEYMCEQHCVPVQQKPKKDFRNENRCETGFTGSAIRRIELNLGRRRTECRHNATIQNRIFMVEVRCCKLCTNNKR